MGESGSLTIKYGKLRRLLDIHFLLATRNRKLRPTGWQDVCFYPGHYSWQLLTGATRMTRLLATIM